MASKGRDLVKDAVADARTLKEVALEAAKNQLAESLSPSIKALLEKSIRSALKEDKPNDQNVGHLGKSLDDPKVKFQEAKDEGGDPMAKEKNDDKELDMESLGGFFPQISEEPDAGPVPELEDENAGFSGIPTLGEEPALDDELPPMKKEGKKKSEEEEEEPEEEEIEISEAELRKVYESALQTEVQVKKGFSEPTKMGELEDVSKDVDKGLADVKKGESPWEKAEPPAKEDFTVKEMLQRGLAENKMLRSKLNEAIKIINTLGSKLHEVNLFNSKVLHVNKILNKNAYLTREQKVVVMESIDKARSISEVRVVFEAIANSFAAVKGLNEGKSRKPATNSQRVRTSGTPKHDVLSESVDRANGGTVKYERMQKLAGLIK